MSSEMASISMYCRKLCRMQPLIGIINESERKRSALSKG